MYQWTQRTIPAELAWETALKSRRRQMQKKVKSEQPRKAAISSGLPEGPWPDFLPRLSQGSKTLSDLQVQAESKALGRAQLSFPSSHLGSHSWRQPFPFLPQDTACSIAYTHVPLEWTWSLAIPKQKEAEYVTLSPHLLMKPSHHTLQPRLFHHTPGKCGSPSSSLLVVFSFLWLTALWTQTGSRNYK